jgi:ADP-ribose pyrophosphatase YjhB (NUDIX family)
MRSSRDLHKAVPVAYVILRQGNKVLLLRRANGGYHDGEYCLPGGHVGDIGKEGGEPAIRAAIREAKEEVGVDIAPENLRLVHVMHRYSVEPEPHERIDLSFETAKWRGELTNAEPDKCDDMGWFAISNLPKNTIPETRHALEMIRRNEPYSDFNF